MKRTTIKLDMVLEPFSNCGNCPFAQATSIYDDGNLVGQTHYCGLTFEDCTIVDEYGVITEPEKSAKANCPIVSISTFSNEMHNSED